jgi:nucleotide-binding universal stress UspA family protein
MQILFATDGSEGALAGAQVLRGLPLTESDRIQVLTVLQHGAEVREGEAALDAACAALGGSAARITRALRRGGASEEVLEEILGAADEMAREAPDGGDAPDLLVVGTSGRSAIARFFLGSVAERVARHAPCPVLLARPLRGGRLDRVIVGTDGSESAERAASWLRQRFPLPTPCEVRLVAVTTPLDAFSSRTLLLSPIADQVQALAQRERDAARERLESLAAALAAETDGGDALFAALTTELRTDDPAQGLIAAAEEHDADLLVVGAQGLSGVERFLIGSVSEKVLRHARCSVLVVRTADAPPPEAAAAADDPNAAGPG